MKILGFCIATDEGSTFIEHPTAHELHEAAMVLARAAREAEAREIAIAREERALDTGGHPLDILL